MLIGSDYIGDLDIRNDTDGAFLFNDTAKNNVEIKSEFDFGMIIGSDSIGDLDIRNDTDKLKLYEDEFLMDDNSDEVFDIGEEFDIQVLR